MAVDSFVFYGSFAAAANKMSDTDRLALYDGIINYSLNDELPKLAGVADIAWDLIKPNLDANKRRRENGALGGSHGEKGGRPSKKNPIGVSDDNPTGDTAKTPDEDVDVDVDVDVDGDKDKDVNEDDFTKQEFSDSPSFPTANAVEQKGIIPLLGSPPQEATKTTEIIPDSQSPSVTNKKRCIQLTEDQKPLFHAAKACFETDAKTKAIMYQDRGSAQMHMENLKLFVVRCNNMAPGITADFMRNVLEHFKVIVNGKLKGRAEFTPRALITPWVWEMVIGSLPEPDNELTAEIRESIRGLFK
jgi:hypothetical protein